jgi:hypothetical protein
MTPGLNIGYLVNRLVIESRKISSQDPLLIPKNELKSSLIFMAHLMSQLLENRFLAEHISLNLYIPLIIFSNQLGYLDACLKDTENKSAQKELLEHNLRILFHVARELENLVLKDIFYSSGAADTIDGLRLMPTIVSK